MSGFWAYLLSCYEKPTTCKLHSWKSETLSNDLGDEVTYLYCEDCQMLAGGDGFREQEIK